MQCLPPNFINPSTGRCVTEEYEIKLTGDTQTEPSKSLGFVATVINTITKQAPTTPVTIKVSLSVEDTSGGHDHGTNTRPKGSLNSIKCASDDTCLESLADGNGALSFNFKPTDASGIHTITASCDKCSNEDAKTVNVQVEGLEQIPASMFYTFVGATPEHSQNHYLKPEAANYLLAIAIYYQTLPQFKKLDWQTGAPTAQPPTPIGVNDASLMWGGKFDINGSWKGSHKEHKRGTSVDIRARQETVLNGNAIPPSSFIEFGKLLNQIIPQGTADGKFILECNQTEKDADGNPVRIPENHCISTLDFSQDTNRHYHVRLLGD